MAIEISALKMSPSQKLAQASVWSRSSGAEYVAAICMSMPQVCIFTAGQRLTSHRELVPLMELRRTYVDADRRQADRGTKTDHPRP
jgi:hypothetical protein